MQTSTTRIIVSIVALLVLAVAGSFAWLFIQNPQLMPWASQVNRSPITTGDNLWQIDASDSVEGKLYLTLVPKTDEPTKIISGYTYDLKTSQMQDQTAGREIFHSFDPAGKVMSYMGTAKDSPYAIYFRQVDNQEQIVTLADIPMGAPTISPNTNQILYTERAKEVIDNQVPLTNKLTIHRVKREADGTWSSEELRQGNSPRWVTDQLFYYLKDDGIYLGDVLSSIEHRAWDTSNNMGSNSRLNISKDKRYLAWTLPDNGEVILFENRYDENSKTFSLKMLTTINTSAFWSAFSPDGSKLAVQAVDWATLHTDPKPRIEIYSVQTGQKLLQEVDLNKFIQTSMFLTDWR